MGNTWVIPVFLPWRDCVEVLQTLHSGCQLRCMGRGRGRKRGKVASVCIDVCLCSVSGYCFFSWRGEKVFLDQTEKKKEELKRTQTTRSYSCWVRVGRSSVPYRDAGTDTPWVIEPRSVALGSGLQGSCKQVISHYPTLPGKGGQHDLIQKPSREQCRLVQMRPAVPGVGTHYAVLHPFCGLHLKKRGVEVNMMNRVRQHVQQ